MYEFLCHNTFFLIIIYTLVKIRNIQKPLICIFASRIVLSLREQSSAPLSPGRQSSRAPVPLPPGKGCRCGVLSPTNGTGSRQGWCGRRLWRSRFRGGTWNPVPSSIPFASGLRQKVVGYFYLPYPLLYSYTILSLDYNDLPAGAARREQHDGGDEQEDGNGVATEIFVSFMVSTP